MRAINMTMFSLQICSTAVHLYKCNLCHPESYGQFRFFRKTEWPCDDLSFASKNTFVFSYEV